MSALPTSESRGRRPALYIAAALLLALFALGVPQASAAAPAPAVQTPAPAETAPPVEVDVDVRGRFDAVYDEIRERTVRMIAHLPLLLAAIVIVLLAARLGRLVSQRLHWLRLRTRNP